MRHAFFSSLLVGSLLVACSKSDPPAAVPQPGTDTGFPIFDAPDNDTGQPLVDSGAPADTSVVVMDTGSTADVVTSDITSTKDTNIGDVTKLDDGGPPKPDTEAPDVISFSDTAVADVIGDAPPPVP